MSPEEGMNHKDEEASLGSPRLAASRNAWNSTVKSINDNSDEAEEKSSKMVPFVQKVNEVDLNRRHRFLEKDGSTNIKFKNISKKKRKFLKDMFTTLIDLGWTEIIILFHLSFYLTWLLFAVIYYGICYHHGDFEPDHLPLNQSASGWKPCLSEVDDFTTVFLFSLETQHSIGYGTREITSECASTMILMSIQSIFGTLIEAFMVGLVFSKLAIPKQRSKTVVFSRNAVICTRDKKMCLMFRVGDMRHDSSLVGAELSVQLVQRKVTHEGEIYDDVTPVKVTPDSSEQSCIIIIWPITLVHVIDKDSPFFKMSAADLMTANFEIHVCLEGTIESTGLTFQARTSYVPNEILWGHRFESMMLYRHDNKKYQINFAAFDSTFEVDTPFCSSYELASRHQNKSEEESSNNQLDYQAGSITVLGDNLGSKLEMS
jgi:potassium inwardly-rectifying channel subfamily J